MQELLNSGLDGMEVLEKRDGSGDSEGIISYFLDEDNQNVPYLSIGIMLTREESQGEGVMGGLLLQIKKIARLTNSTIHAIITYCSLEVTLPFTSILLLFLESISQIFLKNKSSIEDFYFFKFILKGGVL